MNRKELGLELTKAVNRYKDAEKLVDMVNQENEKLQITLASARMYCMGLVDVINRHEVLNEIVLDKDHIFELFNTKQLDFSLVYEDSTSQVRVELVDKAESGE